MDDSTVANPHADTLPSDAASGTRTREPDSLISRTLGHFRLDAHLGRGGMGAVYRAWDSSLERDVALKVLLGASDAARERFLREARVQAKLRHPNVVPIHFVGQSDDVSFLVMDIVDGESLSDCIAREGTLPEARALDVADAIAAALAAGSDAGLVHRDVKPSNILIDKNHRVMLADFGLAKTIEHEPILAVEGSPPSNRSVPNSGALTQAGAIIGTPAYLAPEQARGEAVDFRADMYSLGVTLYEMLAGQPPFTGENASVLLRQHAFERPIAPEILQPSLRPTVSALVMRLLDKQPEKRFASYVELRHAIESARAKATVPATFFVRVVALAVDFAAIGMYALVVDTLTKSATFAWLVAVLSFGALERVWSTPGKKLMRLRVVDEKGDPPSWVVMLFRSVLRLLGPLLIGVTTDVIGAHGLFPSHRLIDTAVSGVIFIVWIVGLAFGLRGRTLHDRITRTHEVFL